MYDLMLSEAILFDQLFFVIVTGLKNDSQTMTGFDL